MFASPLVWAVLAAVIIGVFALALASIFLFGTVAQRRRGEESYCLAAALDATELDRRLGPEVDAHAEMSGLKLLPANIEAFRARLETARLAGRSLDLQYYYWKNDLTGRLLIREVIAAAGRGVRVRLLLDDINSFGFDSTYLALDSHPNIAVRLFNPSRSRTSAFRRGLELVVKYVTATRRMHNKCWIADGRVMISGGRNIGDAYFDASSSANFQDIDVIAIGRCVADAGRVFDSYWNSDSAIPIRLLHKMRRPKLAKMEHKLAIRCAEDNARTYLKLAEAKGSGFDILKDLHWMESAEVMADPPEKAAGSRKDDWLGPRIDKLFDSTSKSLRIISPYFIPGRAGTETLTGLAGHGADIRVLTNSLAATDVIAVHGAYARYRRSLVAKGVALHELKPQPGRRKASLFGSRTASLHTKAFLVDGELGFVGSFNLDPRSRSINTEMGLLFRCAPLAKQLNAVFDAQTALESSYRIEIVNGRIVWRETRDGVPVDHNSEPEAPLARRLPAWLIAWLPIESQL